MEQRRFITSSAIQGGPANPVYCIMRFKMEIDSQTLVCYTKGSRVGAGINNLAYVMASSGDFAKSPLKLLC